MERCKKWIPCLLAAVLLCLPWGIVIVHFQGWRFLLYLLFWVMLPGYVVVERLLKLPLASDVRFLTAFFVGGGMLIAELFLLYQIHALALLPWISPCLFVGTLLLTGGLSRKDWERAKASSQKLAQHWPFLLLLAILVWLSFCRLNLSIPYPQVDMHVDALWETSWINQFASDMPFNDIRIDGTSLRYHFFNTLFLGIGKRIFGGLGYTYLVQYELLYVPELLALSIYSLMRLTSSGRAAAAFCALFCVVGAAWTQRYQNFYVHMTNINATASGIVLLITLYMVILPIVQKQTDRRQTVKRILLAMFLMLLLVGWKSPYAPVLLAGLAAYIVATAWHDRALDKTAGILFLCLAAAFLLGYKALLSSDGLGYNLGSLHDVIHGVLASAQIKGTFGETIYHRLGRGAGALLAAFPFNYFGALTLYGVALLVCCVDGVRYLFGSRTLSPNLILATLTALAGTMAAYTFSLTSYNQLYFLFGGLPFAGMIALDKWEGLKKNTWKAGFAVAALFLIVHSVWINASITPSQIGKTVTDYIMNAEPDVGTIEQEEYEGLSFLREQTPKDSLLATNWSIGEGDNRNSKVTALSERRCYLNGYGYDIRFGPLAEEAEKRSAEMCALFGDTCSDTEKYDLAQRLGIDYIVVFARKEIHAEPKDTALFRPVFKNNSISIYAVEDSTPPA